MDGEGTARTPGDTAQLAPTPGSPLATALERIESMGLRLLISSMGSLDGGLGMLRSTGFEHLDRFATMGVACDGRQLARAFQMVHPIEQGASGSEVAYYDERGLFRFERIDGVGEVHDLHLVDEGLLLVSTGDDQVLLHRPGSGAAAAKLGDSEGRGFDSRHLNCLAELDGRVYATAFAGEGRLPWREAWANLDPGELPGEGVLFELSTGEVVVEGLASPHTPLRWRTSWVLCDSKRHALVVVDDEGGRWELACGGWVRGAALDDDLLFVCVSRLRSVDDEEATSSVLLVDLEARQVLDEIPVPCTEIYDALLVPAALAEGVRRGAGTSSLRLLERAAVEGLWPGTEDPLGTPLTDPSDRAARIEAVVPRCVDAGSTFVLEVELTYLGTSTVASVGNKKVCLGWYWDDENSTESARVGFPAPLRGGEGCRLRFPVRVPRSPGQHRLFVGMLQEHVAWFEGLQGFDVEVNEASRNQPSHNAR